MGGHVKVVMIYNDQIIVSDGYLMTPNLSIYYTYIEPVPKYTDLPVLSQVARGCHRDGWHALARSMEVLPNG